MKPLLPPRFICVPTYLLTLKEIPAQIITTVIRIFALSWNNETHKTPSIALDFIGDYTGLGRTQLYGHLGIAKENALCTWEIPRGGERIFHFPNWFYPAAGEIANPENRIETVNVKDLSRSREIMPNQDRVPIKEDDESLILSTINDSPPHNCSVRNSEQDKKTEVSIPDDIKKILEKIGVYKSLYCEVAKAIAKGWNRDDFSALAAWQQDGGRFIARLRDETKPPEKFYLSRSKTVEEKINAFIENEN